MCVGIWAIIDNLTACHFSIINLNWLEYSNIFQILTSISRDWVSIANLLLYEILLTYNIKHNHTTFIKYLLITYFAATTTRINDIIVIPLSFWFINAPVNNLEDVFNLLCNLQLPIISHRVIVFQEFHMQLMLLYHLI